MTSTSRWFGYDGLCNKVSSALRARMLNRDESRCQMCGSSVMDGVTLHVDHIVPVRKGGQTVDHMPDTHENPPAELRLNPRTRARSDAAHWDRANVSPRRPS